MTLILISLPRQSLVPPDHKDLPFGDHPASATDFGNEQGHHHHQHPHDPDHDVRLFRSQLVPQLATDWMHVWRILILILNSVSLLIALTAIYVKAVIESRPRTRMQVLTANARTLKLD
jgi:hypothetical protein